jgi:hypothetical protein
LYGLCILVIFDSSFALSAWSAPSPIHCRYLFHSTLWLSQHSYFAVIKCVDWPKTIDCYRFENKVL